MCQLVRTPSSLPCAARAAAQRRVAVRLRARTDGPDRLACADSLLAMPRRRDHEPRCVRPCPGPLALLRAFLPSDPALTSRARNRPPPQAHGRTTRTRCATPSTRATLPSSKSTSRTCASAAPPPSLSPYLSLPGASHADLSGDGREPQARPRRIPPQVGHGARVRGDALRVRCPRLRRASWLRSLSFPSLPLGVTVY